MERELMEKGKLTIIYRDKSIITTTNKERYK